MGRIRDAFNAAWPDGPTSNPAQPVKPAIRAAGAVVEEEVAGAAAGAVGPLESWAALAAIPPTRNGQPASVTLADAGTHTDPVVGGTVPNQGIYRGSMSPLGWKRVGDYVDVSSKADQSEVDELSEAVSGKLDNATATNRVLGRKSSGTGEVEQLAPVRGISIDVDGLGLAEMPEATVKMRVAGAGTGAPTDATMEQLKFAAALDQVDNTPDTEKPVSTAQRAAIDEEIDDRSSLIRDAGDQDIILKDAFGFVAARFTREVMSLLGKTLIDVGGDDLIVKDAMGFIAGRLGAGGLTLAGGTSLSAEGGDIVFKDRLGFVVARLGSAGLKVMGRDLGGEIDFRAALGARSAIYKDGALDIPHWRKARANALQGTGEAVIACIGDSNTMGWAVTGVGQHSRALAHPTALAKLLGGRADDGFGRALTGTSGYTTYDPRLTIGAGWVADGPASLGGEMWVNLDL